MKLRALVKKNIYESSLKRPTLSSLREHGDVRALFSLPCQHLSRSYSSDFSNDLPTCPKCRKPMVKTLPKGLAASAGSFVSCTCTPNLLFSLDKSTRNKLDSYNGNYTDQRSSSKQGQQRELLTDANYSSRAANGPRRTGNTFLTPKEVFKGLNEYVIGQDNVKKILSVSVHNHFKIVAFNDIQRKKQEMERAVNNLGTQNDFFPVNHDEGHPQNQSQSDQISVDRATWYHSQLNSGNTWAASPKYREESERKLHRKNKISNPTIKQEFPSLHHEGEEVSVKSFVDDLDDDLLQRITNVTDTNGADVSELDKSNVMIIGPTGSGKTLMAKTLAKLANVPLVTFDATTLTQAGYVGDDVEAILFKLYQAAEYDLELAQRGIVYIDEIDKISKASGSFSGSVRDVSGEGVQQALLKILEGTVCNVPKKAGQKAAGIKAGTGDFVQFDTKNVLFICGGAFAGLEKMIKSRTEKLSIGFGATVGRRDLDEDTKDMGNCERVSKKIDELYSKVEPSDLITYGLIPEFVGRFSHVVSTSQLTTKELISILTEPKNALIKQYRTLFAIHNVTLEVTPEAIDAVARLAQQRRTGARGLRSILDKALTQTMFDMPDKEDLHLVIINEDVINGKSEPIFVTKAEDINENEAEADSDDNQSRAASAV